MRFLSVRVCVERVVVLDFDDKYLARCLPPGDVIEQQAALLVGLERVGKPFTDESMPTSCDNCSCKVSWIRGCVRTNSDSTVLDNTRRAEDDSSGAEERLDVLLGHVLADDVDRGVELDRVGADGDAVYTAEQDEVEDDHHVDRCVDGAVEEEQ